MEGLRKELGFCLYGKSPMNRCVFFPTSQCGPHARCCALEWGEETAMCFCLGATCSIVQVSQLTSFLLWLWNSKHNVSDSFALNLIRQVENGPGRPESLVNATCPSESWCISHVLTTGSGRAGPRTRHRCTPKQGQEAPGSCYAFPRKYQKGWWKCQKTMWN